MPTSILLALPALVFAGPQTCPRAAVDPCKTFLDTMQHPAIVRRLDDYEFKVEPQQADKPSLLVRDGSGNTAVQWYDIPNRRMLAQILNMMDGALPYLDNSDPYDPALAALALGNAARGRALLEELRTSENVEARELATIWLGKLNGAKDPAAVANYAKNGATPRVRFEAWMETARLAMLAERVSDATAAVNEAAEQARTVNERKATMLTRQYFEERRNAIFGLGRQGELIYGRRTLQPRALPKTVARVQLRLDGKLSASSTKAPFAATVDFGRIPKRQVLELTALDRGGKVVQRANVVINERSGASGIDLTESGSEAVAVVRAPRGSVAEEVRIEWNGKTLATFSKPPYRTPLKIGDETGVLRAVARFDDGTEVEDARLLNSGAMLTSDVHLMEVPVYFESGKPTPVDVRENSQFRPVERVVPASEAPLRIALVLDSSYSMVPHMLDLQEAALRFVDENLDARDEVMVAGFGASIDVLRPTRDRKAIEHSVLSLRASGPTPLHDALIQSMLDLQVGGSRRALVVFSDGVDTSSVFRAIDVEEVTRRVGVPIYVLYFVTPTKAEPVQPGRTAPTISSVLRDARRELETLAKRSGGKSYEVQSLDKLHGIWNEIGADLRRQALVLFRTEPGVEDEWRRLDITTRNGSALRAPVGVYVTGKGRAE